MWDSQARASHQVTWLEQSLRTAPQSPKPENRMSNVLCSATLKPRQDTALPPGHKQWWPVVGHMLLLLGKEPRIYMLREFVYLCPRSMGTQSEASQQ